MIERVALFVGSLASALVLAAALAVAGVHPAAPSAPAAALSPTVSQPTDPPVQVDTVYLTQPAPKQVVVHRTVGARHGDDEGGGEDG